MDATSTIMFGFAFAMGVLFIAFTLATKRPEWSILSGITWFAVGIVNAAVATDDMFVAFTWMYFGVGTVFFLYTFMFIFEDFKQKRNDQNDIFTIED